MKIRNLLEADESYYVSVVRLSDKFKKELNDLIENLDENDKTYEEFILDFANEAYKTNNFIKDGEPVLIDDKLSNIISKIEKDKQLPSLPEINEFDGVMIGGITYFLLKDKLIELNK